MIDINARMITAAKGYVVESNGLYYEDRTAITFEQWKIIGREIAQAHNASQWALGDWILSALGEYGERYALAVSVTGLSRTYVQALATVSAAYSRERRTGLSWSHYHRALSAPVGPQDQPTLRRDTLLQRARNEHLPVSVVIAETVRMNRESEEDKPKSRRHRAPANNLRQVICPHCGTTFPIVGHLTPQPTNKGV